MWKYLYSLCPLNESNHSFSKYVSSHFVPGTKLSAGIKKE